MSLCLIDASVLFCFCSSKETFSLFTSEKSNQYQNQNQNQFTPTRTEVLTYWIDCVLSGDSASSNLIIISPKHDKWWLSDIYKRQLHLQKKSLFFIVFLSSAASLLKLCSFHSHVLSASPSFTTMVRKAKYGTTHWIYAHWIYACQSAVWKSQFSTRESLDLEETIFKLWLLSVTIAVW